MRKLFNKILNKGWELLLGPVLRHIDSKLRILADSNFRTRALFKRSQNRPIKVVFVCHEPAMWSMFESIYKAMKENPDFSAVIVTLPHRHITLPKGQYKDAGMFEFLESRNIPAVRGYDKEKNEWLDPASLMPDYVFFQQPYQCFTPEWFAEKISLLARVCYIPYGSTFQTGEMPKKVHNERFLRHTSLFFMENKILGNMLEKEFRGRDWFNKGRVIASGHPKLDFIQEDKKYRGTGWKRGTRADIKRILWTPRWLTSEGTCHFFDYKGYFAEFCRSHKEVDFIFRPHPVCLQNFIKTGEMTLEEQKNLRAAYAASPNMALDEDGSYEDTFMTSDLLVSDLSSMMLEYFATGKPIIYTHRKDYFDEYGRILAEGLYWARNVKELDELLAMLLSGKDPLRSKREELKKELFFIPEGGAGRLIKDYLIKDFNSS